MDSAVESSFTAAGDLLNINPKGIAMNYEKKKLFWIEGFSLKSCNVDGTNVVVEQILSRSFSFTAYWSTSSYVLRVTALISGEITIGDYIKADGISTGTKITSQLTGGIGQYTVGTSQTLASTTISATSSAVIQAKWSGFNLIVTSVTSGTLMPGQMLFGSGNPRLSQFNLKPVTI